MIYDFRTQASEKGADGFGFINWSHDSHYLYYMRHEPQPATFRIRLGDRKIEEVASLTEIRDGGSPPGLQFALAPDDSPVLLRDSGTEEIYSLNWRLR